jgi:hypothetical protein
MTDAEIANVFAQGNAKSYAAGLRAVFNAGAASTKIEAPAKNPVEAEPVSAPKAPKKRSSKKA